MRHPTRIRAASVQLWVWPLVSGSVGFVAALLLLRIRVPATHRLARLAWPGDADAASTMLQTVAASVITVTALTFTLTIVALQLASQQFSPRLLREFARDRVIKLVLAIMVATYVVAITVLRGMDADRPLPTVAVAVAFLLGVATLAAVLGFVAHIARVLRVDTMMLAVHDETDRVIDTFYPAYGDPAPRSPEELGLADTDGVVVLARSSGFVRRIDVPALLSAARDHDAVLRMEVRAGDHLVRGTPMATVWACTDAAPSVQAIGDAIHQAMALGYERTIEQDAAFGFRQLTDIAVKALSPGINDPVTAAHAVGHMSDLLVRLTSKRLGATLHEDTDGVGRVIVPDRDLRYYLDLACGQVRRYGQREPTVLAALLGMLRDVAASARDDQHRSEIARQVEFICAEVPPSTPPHDAEQVNDLAQRVRQALGGDLRDAFWDRSGETRSI